MHLNATLVIEIISFLILMAILTRLLYKPLLSIMDRRSENIKNLLKESQNARKEAEIKLKDAEALMKKAKQDVIDMEGRSRIRMDEMRRKILDEAKQEAQRMLVSAKQEIEHETETARLTIKKEIADIAILIAEKILQREVKKEDHLKLVDDLLKEIEKDERVC